MKVSKNDILFGGAILGFIGTIVYAIDVTSKLKKVAEKLDKSVDDLTSDVEIDIPASLVQTAVEKAAKDEAKYQVERAMTDARKDIVRKYTAEIENVVDDEFKIQRGDVEKTLKRKIGSIDIHEIRRDVIRETKAECAEKIKKDLDDLSDKYTEQVDNMISIYSKINDKIDSQLGD